MSKIAKLTGIGSYMSPLLNDTNVQRGDVIHVSDEVFERIQGVTTTPNDGIEIDYFTEMPAGTPIKFNFVAPSADVVHVESISAIGSPVGSLRAGDSIDEGGSDTDGNGTGAGTPEPEETTTSVQPKPAAKTGQRTVARKSSASAA